MKKKNFLIMFDIPEVKGNLKRRVNRKLHKINAEIIQQSVWKSKDLNNLMQIASTIKHEGGQVTILKEEIIVDY